jgi:hypothetical protein
MTPRNSTPPRSRARRFASAVAVAGVLDGSQALAQEPVAATAKTADVVAVYNGLNPTGSFSFKLNGESYTKPVGMLHWNVSPDRLTAAGLDRAFTAFCAEPLVGVAAGTTYRFDLQSPDEPAAYGLPVTDEGKAEAKLRGTYIRELFGRHYLTSLNFQSPDNARAFQAALWELAFETRLPLGADAAQNRFSLGTGTFQSDYPAPAEAPAFAGVAEQYLQSLTGDDSIFSTALEGRELVRLNGLPNAAGVIAQDQYALRTAQAAAAGAAAPGAAGGVTGAGLGGTGGGGAGGGGFGAPVGGSGGGFGGGFGGGGGGFSVVPPTSTINVPPTSPPQSVSPPPFSPPPINSPPPPPPPQSPPPGSPPPGSPPPGSPPPGSPPPGSPPPNAVPAPPGLLLGGIAALALAGRRAFRRNGSEK